MSQPTPGVVIGAAAMGAFLGVGLAHADGPAQPDHRTVRQPSPNQVVLSEPLTQSRSVNHLRGADPVGQLHSFELPSADSHSDQMPSPLLTSFGDLSRDDATLYHGRHRREDRIHAAPTPPPRPVPPRRAHRVHTAQRGGMSGGGMSGGMGGGMSGGMGGGGMGGGGMSGGMGGGGMGGGGMSGGMGGGGMSGGMGGGMGGGGMGGGGMSGGMGGGMGGGGMMEQKGLVSGLACPVLHALKL